MSTQDDPYELLDIPRSASLEEVKKRYRELAREMHPDRNPNADEARWKKISEAYATLGRVDLRQKYDEPRNRTAEEHATKAREAREARKRNAAQAKAYGDGIRGRRPTGAASSPKQPPTRPRTPPPQTQPPQQKPPQPASQQTQPRPSSQPPLKPPPLQTQPQSPPRPARQAPIKRANWWPRVALIGGIIGAFLVILALASSGGGAHRVSNTLTTQRARPKPVAKVAVEQPSLPKTASDQLDVVPTYESAGIVSINEPRGEPPAYIPFTLSSELHGFLLKVNVKASYTPTDIRKLKEGIDPIGSIKNAIETTCIGVSLTDDGHESYRLTPVASRVQQHGLTATGTLYYPAVLPGEYLWGCLSEGQRLGKVTTENLGVLGNLTVYKVHQALTDTVVLVGAVDGVPFTENEPFLSEICLHAGEAPSNETQHPAKVKVYHRWLSGESEPNMVAALTFDVAVKQIERSSIYPPICDVSGEPGISLADPGR